MKSFREKVLEITSKIPKGKTLTYKEVATLAGNPKASRGVGAILKTNFNPDIPCHRVIKSTGETGGYNRGEKNKKEILRAEGVVLN